MGTLKVDNIQTESGTSIISNGLISASSNVGMVLLNKTVCSGATEVVYNSTTLQSSTYENYKLIINNLVPATDSAYLRFRTSSDNGSSLHTGTWSSGAHWSSINSTSTGGASLHNNVDYGSFYQHFQNTASRSASIELTMNNLPSSTGGHYWFAQTANSKGGNGGHFINNDGFRSFTTVSINYIKFYFSSGNISTGTFRLYGLV